MGATSIEWTDVTWNPVTGCDKVSPGCTHCYAQAMAKRLKAMGQPRYQRDGANPLTSGPGFGVTLHLDVLQEPLHWRKPRRVFVNSMSDLFHEEVPDEFIDRVFAVMMLAPQHTFQLLTKRPERMLSYLTAEDRPVHWADGGLTPKPASTPTKILWEAQGICEDGLEYLPYPTGMEMLWPLPNVWLGVSVESQRWTSRLDVLAKIPAAVRFVSAEPLLGPLDLRPRLYRRCACGGSSLVGSASPCLTCHRNAWLPSISWVIVGGESGPGARRCRLEWVRGIIRQCRVANVPCFVKQLGDNVRQTILFPAGQIADASWPPDKAIRHPAPKGGQPTEWPEDLRVREFPKEAL